MLDPGLFLRGFLLGLSVAAPVGPIGVLCIRRTLADGRLVGFVSGLGATTADAIYGAVAGFGLTAVRDVLTGQQGWLRLVGGAFLLYLGVRTFLSKPAQQAASAQGRGLVGAYVSTFFLTITNPMTIIAFAAMFAGLGLVDTGGDVLAALSLVAGVAAGSAAWWLTLSGVVSLFRARFDGRAMLWINRASGVMIVAFGAAALGSLLAGA